MQCLFESISRPGLMLLGLEMLSSREFSSLSNGAIKLSWVRGMCEPVEIVAPGEEESLALAYRAIAWITCRVQAGLPGAVEAIRVLHQQGYPLHVASGSCSFELAGYLDAILVHLDHFLVELDVFLCHDPRGEMLLNIGAQAISVNLIDTGHVLNHFSNIVNQEAIFPIHHDL